MSTINDFTEEQRSALNAERIPPFTDYIVFLSVLTILSFSLFVFQPNPVLESQLTQQELALYPVSRWFTSTTIYSTLIEKWFVLLLFAGGVLAYLYFFIKNVKVHTLIAPGKTALVRLVKNCSKTLGLKYSPRIYLTANQTLELPWVFWAGRSILIVPTNFIKRFGDSTRETEAVIYHELAHVLSGDAWKVMLVQCLSMAYVLLGTIYLFVKLISLVPEWYWAKPLIMIIFWANFPILLSAGILFFLNMALLREREFVADRLTAAAMNTATPLRTVLALTTISGGALGTPETKREIKLLRFIKENLRPHPQTRTRNRFLFDPKLYLIPKPGYTFAIGFVSITVIEGGMRAIGLNPVGEGVMPFLANLLGNWAGIYGLAVSIFPLIIFVYAEKLPKFEVPILNIITVHCFGWALGGTLGAILSFAIFDPFLWKFVSIWGWFSTYGGYYPFFVGLSIVFSWIILAALVGGQRFHAQTGTWRRLFYFALLIGTIPLFIWLLVYMKRFETINTFGLGSAGMRLGLGIILIYCGIIFLFLNSQQSGKKRGRQVALTSPPFMKLSETPHVDRTLRSGTFLVSFIFIWFLGFEVSQYFRLQDQTAINAWLQDLEKPPLETAPEGFIRLNDPTLHTSVLYPENWTPVRGSEDDLAIYSPDNQVKLTLITYPQALSITPESVISMTSAGIFEDPDYLLDRASPISISTKAGMGNGYKVDFTLSGDIYTSVVAINMPKLSYGVSYTFSVFCEPSVDTNYCQSIFETFLSNFDYLSPNINVTANYPSNKSFRDKEKGFQFNYPIAWAVSGVIDSLDYSGDDVYFQLPEDAPVSWNQIILSYEPEETANPTSSPSIIVVQELDFDRFVDPSIRLKKWEEFYTHDGQTISWMDTVPLNGRDVPRLNVQINAKDIGPIYTINLVVFQGEKGLFEITSFCSQIDQDICTNASKLVQESFQDITR